MKPVYRRVRSAIPVLIAMLSGLMASTAINGNAGPSSLGSTDPNANFTY